jgi:CheY-like chemotaxis protein
MVASSRFSGLGKHAVQNVLIVEDEPHISHFIAVNLRARGFSVTEVGSAEEGLQRLRQTLPDLVLLDIKLPGMNGWALLKAVNEDPALIKTPVIVMSASSWNNQPDEYPYPNLVAKLTKPISAIDLMEIIRSLAD